MTNLPGNIRSIEPDEHWAEYCEDCPHPRIGGAFLARFSLQGETDSFGAEYHHLCAKHLNRYKAQERKAVASEMRCDLCNTMQRGCRPWRDFDEGANGPVYTVCLSCRHKHSLP